jgi:hypothetical protein
MGEKNIFAGEFDNENAMSTLTRKKNAVVGTAEKLPAAALRAMGTGDDFKLMTGYEWSEETAAECAQLAEMLAGKVRIGFANLEARWTDKDGKERCMAFSRYLKLTTKHRAFLLSMESWMMPVARGMLNSALMKTIEKLADYDWDRTRFNGDPVDNGATLAKAMQILYNVQQGVAASVTHVHLTQINNVGDLNDATSKIADVTARILSVPRLADQIVKKASAVPEEDIIDVETE